MSISVTYKRESGDRIIEETLITDMNDNSDAAIIGKYIHEAMKSSPHPHEVTIKQLSD